MQLETVGEAATRSLRKLEILVTENIHKQKTVTIFSHMEDHQ